MIYIFGKGDMVALPKLTPFSSGISPEIIYPSLNMKGYYSSYGFAFPLDCEAVPFHLLMDGKVPPATEHAKRPQVFHHYLFIDHNALMWKAVIVTGPEVDTTVSYLHIDAATQDWWIAYKLEEIASADTLRLSGFLYTDPKRKAIDAYWFKFMGAKELVWTSVKEVAFFLNDMYPKSFPSKAKDTEV